MALTSDLWAIKGCYGARIRRHYLTVPQILNCCYLSLPRYQTWIGRVSTKPRLLFFVIMIGPCGTDGDGEAVAVFVGALAKTFDVATED